MADGSLHQHESDIHPDSFTGGPDHHPTLVVSTHLHSVAVWNIVTRVWTQGFHLARILALLALTRVSTTWVEIQNVKLLVQLVINKDCGIRSQT